MNGRRTSVCWHINMFRLPGKRIRKRHSRSVRPLLSVFLGRFSNGFPRGGKLVACFFKLVARILKSEPLIFSLFRRGANALKTSFHFSAPEMPVSGLLVFFPRLSVLVLCAVLWRVVFVWLVVANCVSISFCADCFIGYKYNKVFIGFVFSFILIENSAVYFLFVGIFAKNIWFFKYFVL